jgi:hypothetical protein
LLLFINYYCWFCGEKRKKATWHERGDLIKCIGLSSVEVEGLDVAGRSPPLVFLAPSPQYHGMNTPTIVVV